MNAVIDINELGLWRRCYFSIELQQAGYEGKGIYSTKDRIDNF